MEKWQELNNMVGEQLSVIIEQMHGEKLPFILVMAPVDPDHEAQLVTNIDNIKYIQKTLRFLDESLSKVKKLMNSTPAVQ